MAPVADTVITSAAYRPPAGPPRRIPPAVAVGSAVLGVVVLVGVVLVALRPWVTPPQATEAGGGAAVTGAVPVASPSPRPADPASLLAQEVSADRPVAETLVGAWVPQISSKAVGLVADGVVYDEALIWQDYAASRAARADAVLVRSDDFTSFKRPDFWVTLVAERFPSAEEANAWCDGQGMAADRCFAKRLSHTDGPTGNTVPR